VTDRTGHAIWIALIAIVLALVLSCVTSFTTSPKEIGART